MHAFDYSFDLEGYIMKERFARLKEFASDKETPFVVLSRDVVGRKYERPISFCVLTNPHPLIC